MDMLKAIDSTTYVTPIETDKIIEYRRQELRKRESDYIWFDSWEKMNKIELKNNKDKFSMTDYIIPDWNILTNISRW